MDIREKLKQRNNPKKPLKVQLRLKPKIKTKKSVINTIPNVSDSTDSDNLKDTVVETTTENENENETDEKVSSFSGPTIIDKTDSNFDIVAFELNMKMAKNPKLSVLGQSPDLKNTLDVKSTDTKLTVKDETLTSCKLINRLKVLHSQVESHLSWF